MSKEEVIEQLKSLKSHCEDFADVAGVLDEDNIWNKDVKALEYAIKVLEEGAV